VEVPQGRGLGKPRRLPDYCLTMISPRTAPGRTLADDR
jgi:hypothetical protein